MNKSYLMSGRSANSLIGRSIFTIDQGKKIGSIKDVVYDSEHSKLLAFTIEEPGIFSSHRQILPFDNVKSIGEDVVMVENENVFMNERDVPDVRSILQQKNGINKKCIITESGNVLGYLADVLIDEKTGDAISYEVTGGFTRDIGSGRNFVAALDARVVGKHAIILPDEAETTIKEQEPGGLAGAYASAKERGREYGEGVSEYTQQKEIDMSRGKTAGRDITDDEGGLIVGKGKKITDSVIEEAVSKGKMHDVAMAAGVGGLAGGYKRMHAGITGAAKERLKGRRVPYDITDDQGNVVIEEGTVITDQTLNRASEMGVSNDLASAVLGSTARGGAESLWDTTKDWASRTWSNITAATERSADKTSRRRAISAQKSFLTGKISAVDVHDDMNNVVLKKGEVITPLVLDDLDRQGKLTQVKPMPEKNPEDEYGAVHVVLEKSQEHSQHKTRSHI